MEIALALAFLAIVLIVVAPIIALSLSTQAIKRSKAGEQELRQIKSRLDAMERQAQALQKLSARLSLVEKRVADLAGAAAHGASAAPFPVPVSKEEPQFAEGHPAAGPGTRTFKGATNQAEHPSRAPQAEAATPPQPAIHDVQIASSAESASRQLPPKPHPAVISPVIASAHRPAVTTDPRISPASLEEKLGTNWLNKLGIIILVIGIALLIGYKLRTLGPAGKDLVGFIVAAAMLAGGVFFEGRERWRTFARAGIGGGWALLFFVAYAMRHVNAARVLDSNAADIFLLLLVGAGMLAHTLRYRSQGVTGLAFFLAFLTISSNRGDVSGLYANAVLALALAVIAVRLGWFELEIFGILAVNITHYFWLRPIVESLPMPHPEFAGYALSSVLLAFYWVVFLVSYLTRRVEDARQEKISTVAAILSAGLFIWVIGYQSVHPEKAFQFFLAVGAVELIAGQLSIARRRRAAFVLLTLIGSSLLVAAVPYRFSHQSLSVLWLAEAEAFFLAGVFLREIVFRRLGMLAGFATAIQIILADTRQVDHVRAAAVGELPLPHFAIIYAAAAATLYFNAHGAAQRWPEIAEPPIDRYGFRAASYTAGTLAVLGTWVAVSPPWAAVGWALLAVVSIWVAARLHVSDLALQAHTIAALSLLRALTVNLEASWRWHQLPGRLVTVCFVAASLYLCSRWADWDTGLKRGRLPAVYTWAASALMALLLWYELPPVGVALGWTLFGLALFELGMIRKFPALRWQAYAAFLASFARIFFVNLNAQAARGAISPRVYTVLPLALAFYYVSERLRGREDDDLPLERRLRASGFHNLLGMVTIAALVRFESPSAWVIVGWAAMALALVAAARLSGRRIFLDEGLALGFAILFRAVLHNLYEQSYFLASFWQSRWLCVGLTATILFLTLAIAFPLRRKQEPQRAEDRAYLARFFGLLDRHPEQVFFFIPVFLLTLLLALEMRKGMVTVAWGLEAVAVFLCALAIGERTFRLTGLGLLLLCVGKILVFDFWEMTTPDKILTAIVIGTALTGVSFLYTRYRESLRQYL